MTPDGYKVITEAVTPVLQDLSKPRSGIVTVSGPEQFYQPYRINREGLWDVPSEEVLDKNGWKSAQVPNVE